MPRPFSSSCMRRVMLSICACSCSVFAKTNLLFVRPVAREPLGQIAAHPRLVHFSQGTFRSHLSLSRRHSAHDTGTRPGLRRCRGGGGSALPEGEPEPPCTSVGRTVYIHWSVKKNIRADGERKNGGISALRLVARQTLRTEKKWAR